MKIRINGNSIRLRLTKSEVVELVHNGNVNAHCEFVQGKLTYRIIQTANDKMNAELVSNIVTVFVPEQLVEHWDTDERVGFEYQGENGLYILVEKDFQYMKPRLNEDESDLFPNPQSNFTSYDG